jgi:ribonuclease HI
LSFRLFLPHHFLEKDVKTKNNPHLVSVFTDASYCHSGRAYGWAVWMKCGGKTVRRSGQHKMHQENATHAELSAIGYGILLALKEFPKASAIHVVSDSLNAIQIMQGKMQRRKGYEQQITAYIIEEACKHDKRLTFKHVKAHSTLNSPRRHVNNWCDKAAKHEMRRMREQIGATA